MDKRYLSPGQTAAFARALRAAERSPGTIEKYLRDVCQFAAWAGGGAVSREGAAAWRDSLLERGYAPVTVNSMVAAVNQFFAFLGWEDCKVFPHNLRHLFARTFYKVCRDVVKLADVRATAAWKPPASISSPPGRSTREF